MGLSLWGLRVPPLYRMPRTISITTLSPSSIFSFRQGIRDNPSHIKKKLRVNSNSQTPNGNTAEALLYSSMLTWKKPITINAKERRNIHGSTSERIAFCDALANGEGIDKPAINKGIRENCVGEMHPILICFNMAPFTLAHCGRR